MQYSIVRKIKLDEIVIRLDAEYYHPDFIRLEEKLNRLHSISLRSATASLYCSAFYPSIVPYYNFEKVGVPFLRVNEIQNGLLNISTDTAFLPESILEENKSTIARCHSGDIIIAKGGNTLAKIALLTDEYPIYSVCRDVIILRTSKLININRYYLWIFLYSDFGKKLLLRTASQTGQPHLTIEAIYNLDIPTFSNMFQGEFEWLYRKSEELKSQAQNMDQEAEHTLLSELGLTNWHPKHQLSFVNNYSNVQQAERIDAEYFQPKYDEIVDAIKSYKDGWNTLGNLVKIKDKNFSPRDDVFYKYIELSNIGFNGEITGCTEEFGKDLPTRARRTVSTGDVIISSIEGSLSSIALIPQEFNKALCSTGFYVIDSELYNSETLLCLLKSIVGQMQLKKGCTGTILTAINKDAFSRIILPNISDQIQETTKGNISSGYESKAKSKQLLEIAKQGVEMAIEQNEAMAKEWIKMQIQNLDTNLNHEK